MSLALGEMGGFYIGEIEYSYTKSIRILNKQAVNNYHVTLKARV